MATEQDAARDQVLAARTQLDSELEVLEASARYAVDIPARIRQSPAKAAAIAGGAGFLLLRGPSRMYRFARRAVFGAPAPMPKRMLPDEIEKTLRSLGDDGDKVRGALERDFADYAKKAEKNRTRLLPVLLLAFARPLLARGGRAAWDYLFSPNGESFGTRLADVRANVAQGSAVARASAERNSEAARERAERARRSADTKSKTDDEAEPTGI